MTISFDTCLLIFITNTHLLVIIHIANVYTNIILLTDQKAVTI